MIKKTLPIVVIAILAFYLPALAFLNSDVKKAKDFIKAGMYPQAIELLNKRINEKPTDAEAHLLLGSSYLHQGNVSMAEQRFDSAMKLEPKYRDDVAIAYRSAGDANLGKGNLAAAQRYYGKAIHANPALRSDIAKSCFDRGAATLSKPYFDMAINLDPAYKMKSYNVIMDKAGSASDSACLGLYQMAGSYCGKQCDRGKKAGDRLLAISKKIEDKDVFDERVEQYKDAARQFIEVPPSVVVYEPNKDPDKPHKFVFTEAGQRLDHWVGSPDNMDLMDEIFSTNDNFKIYLRQSKIVVDYSKGEKIPKEAYEDDMKFEAITPVTVMLVRKKTII